jgi:hypothetical protein
VLAFSDGTGRFRRRTVTGTSVIWRDKEALRFRSAYALHDRVRSAHSQTLVRAAQFQVPTLKVFSACAPRPSSGVLRPVIRVSNINQLAKRSPLTISVRI